MFHRSHDNTRMDTDIIYHQMDNVFRWNCCRAKKINKNININVSIGNKLSDDILSDTKILY
jgi:hypothetical protein